MSRGVIWVEITGEFCANGIDAWWEYEVEPDSCREWLAFRRELYPNAYEWRAERGCVELRSPFDNKGWQYVLTVLPVGVTADMQLTHPYVNFHYQER